MKAISNNVSKRLMRWKRFEILQSCSKLFKRLGSFVAKAIVDPVSKEKGLIQDAL